MKNLRGYYKYNEFQTPYESLNLDRYPEEISRQFDEFMATVPYLQWLSSPDRPSAKDLPRDEYGRIIVDVTHPHILEDMDYFRPAALHYMETGRYCDFTPNANPNSPYMKWFLEETKRCWYGYVRESDGEWIPGDYYFFLNYCPMNLTDDKKRSGRRAKRVKGFPRVWEGHYLKYHYLEQARNHGHHAAELSSRGKGKSVSGAAMLAKRFIIGEDRDVSSGVVSYITASDKKYLVANGDQTLDKFEFIINFIAQQTDLQWPSQRITSTLQNMQWQMGYRDVSSGVKKGTQNSVVGVSSKDDASKLRGSRGVLYIFEEFGSFNRLDELYNNVRFSVEEGSAVYGLLYAYGTSGESASDFQSAQEMVYNPEGYNLESLDNVYDKSGQGRRKFTYFFPGYINRDGCYDENGNSDVTKALFEILRDRYQVKHNSTKLSTITRRVAEYPITPQEAMLRTSGNMFPVSELNERLNQLLSDPHALDDVYTGTLVMNSSKNIEFVPTSDVAITEFPLKDSKNAGALQIFKMPERDSQGNVFRDRYLCSVDPVDSDEADSVSLYSIFVLDLWTDEIAAEYTGRYPFADDCHELVRKICMFYNCKVLYENNIKGMYSYFSKMGCTHLLEETPEYLKDKNLVKIQGIGNRSYGVTATNAINNYANQLIRDWLLKPFPTIVRDEEGNEVERTISNLYRLKNIALIRELVAYNPEINVDRIRSVGLLMLFREEKMILYGGNPRSANEDNDRDYLGDDDFFKRNYDERFGMKVPDYVAKEYKKTE